MHFLLHLIYFVKNISVHLCFHGIGWWFQVAERFPSFVREHWEHSLPWSNLAEFMYIYICIAIVGYWKLYISMFNLFLCAIIHHDISWCTNINCIHLYIYISYMSKLTNLYMEDALRPLWLHWMHHVHVKMILGVMFFFLTAFLLCYLLEVAASTFTLVGSSSQKTNGRFVFHTRGMLEVQRGETFQIWFTWFAGDLSYQNPTHFTYYCLNAIEYTIIEISYGMMPNKWRLSPGIWCLPCICGRLTSRTGRAFSSFVYTRLHTYFLVVPGNKHLVAERDRALDDVVSVGSAGWSSYMYHDWYSSCFFFLWFQIQSCRSNGNLYFQRCALWGCWKLGEML